MSEEDFTELLSLLFNRTKKSRQVSARELYQLLKPERIDLEDEKLNHFVDQVWELDDREAFDFPKIENPSFSVWFENSIRFKDGKLAFKENEDYFSVSLEGSIDYLMTSEMACHVACITKSDLADRFAVYVVRTTKNFL